ncbi:MAG: sulfatase-like hydrolase/transferase [Candidatus Nanopelagicales bacterium]|nr:sulfatase-like hydrolase/transferase [Candidatus Nanopelagicales bacterium]
MRRQMGLGRVTCAVIGVSLLVAASALLAPQTVGGGAASADPVRSGVRVASASEPNEAVLSWLRRSLSGGKPWNVVVVLTDDQPKSMMEDMTAVRRQVAARGITYPNALVPESICCPSRSALLTGRLSDETGVYDNTRSGPPGGYWAFRSNGNEKRTIAVALRKAGYRTGLFGKYFNEFGKYFTGKSPKGWSQFQAFTTTSRSGRYFSYPASTLKTKRQKRRAASGKAVRNYSVRVLKKYSTKHFGQQTVRFIKSTPRRKPLFALLTPYAPHSPFRAKQQHRSTLTDTRWWASDPSIMEQDVSDKPKYVTDQDPEEVLANNPLGSKYVRQRETLLSVDNQVRKIVKVLRRTGRLHRTLLVYTSDNGYLHGQHRLMRKFVPYRAATEVPLMIRYGNRTPVGLSDSRIAGANIDLSATIMAAAHVPWTSAGMSLIGTAKRTGLPLKAAAYSASPSVRRPPYCGWRTDQEAFVRYGSGEEEYYDYVSDPFELTNRADDPEVADRVAVLRSAARLACADVPPDFGPSFDEPSWEYPPDPTPEPTPEPTPSESPSESPSATP